MSKITLIDAIHGLLVACQNESISLTLEFDHGRRLPGEYIGKPDANKHVVQGPAGWTVEVAGMSFQEEDGSEMMFATIGSAVVAGWKLLDRERQEKRK